MSLRLLLFCAFFLAACDGDARSVDAGGDDDAGARGLDAGPPPPDAGAPDGGSPDAGLVDAGAEDAGVADAGAMASAVTALCREVSMDWAVMGARSDGSPECAQISEGVAEMGICERLPDFCLETWRCLGEQRCVGGNPDRVPVCTEWVRDPAVGRRYSCLIGVYEDAPPPIASPADAACRRTSAHLTTLEVGCFGAGGGWSDRFCARTDPGCEGFFDCVAAEAYCDHELHTSVWPDSCDALMPSGFDCRAGR